MNDKWYRIEGGDSITLFTMVAGQRTYTEEHLKKLMWPSLAAFIDFLDEMGFARRPIAEAPEAKPDPWAAHLDKMEAAEPQTFRLPKPQEYTPRVRKPAPLPYFTEQQERAKFDPFKGWFIDRETGADLSHVDYMGDVGFEAKPTHPLQRLADGHSPVFGSAALLR